MYALSTYIPAVPKHSYHHGDLRRALLDVSTALLRKRGPAGLTLRAVARAAGVSQTAPYRHFPDRMALVAAVAEDGFNRLRDRMFAAVTAPSPRGSTERARLQRLAIEYLRFGIEHPAEYRIMFGGELTGAAKTLAPSFNEARGSVFELLRIGIERLQEGGMVRKGDAAAMALSAWALMHGLVMLTLDGQVARGGDMKPEELADTATNLMMFGMNADAKRKR